MSDAQTEEEPSIEEILDSIRQIISDDDEEEGTTEQSPSEAPAASEPQPKPQEEPEDDVVELTEQVGEPETQTEPAPAPEPEPATEVEPDPEPIQNKIEEDIEIDMTDAVNDPFDELANIGSDNMSEDDVITNGAERAAAQAFSNLARTALIERAGQITMEDVVRQEVRPLLKNWLNDNLPEIVERLLEKELQRISNRYLDD